MYCYSCPACTNNERFYRVRREGLSGFSVLIAHLTLAGGWFLKHHGRNQVQCAQCGYVFPRPALGKSSAAKSAMVLLACLYLAVVLGIVVELAPDLFAMFPGWEYVLTLGEIVQQHSTGIAVASTVGVFLATILGISMSVVGNWRHHRKIQAKHDYEPTEFPPQPPPTEVQMLRSECSQCGYNLTGNVSGGCPECGQPVEGTVPATS